jgi:hypothetical protein
MSVYKITGFTGDTSWGYRGGSRRRADAARAAALTEHDRGVVADDPTVGAYWDADRLHLVGLGVRVRLDLLSTDAARDLARERGIAA